MNKINTPRGAEILAFTSSLHRDRAQNLTEIVKRAKLLKMAGFEGVEWPSASWIIVGGRLVKEAGKNKTVSQFNFLFPMALGGHRLPSDWDEVCKALFLLRFHRRQQSASNQRNFITAVAFVAHAAQSLGLTVVTLNKEALDHACREIDQHYSESTSYNLHKAIVELAGHCDANGLCSTHLGYKPSNLKRPKSTGGVGIVRLDDPKADETVHEKMVSPDVYRMIGELYRNIPINHKYRFYVLILVLLCCLGRRFTEISLLPFQQVETDRDGKAYVNYFKRKATKGDAFTPQRKLYMPTAVVPIVKEVIRELGELCTDARKCAAEMMSSKDVDLRFLDEFPEDYIFGTNDLERIGISATTLSVTGWIRTKGHAFSNYRSQESKPDKSQSRYTWFTNKSGVREYCRKDFKKATLEPIHTDQSGKNFYLSDLLLVRYVGLSSGAYSKWAATQCTHSMMTTFLRYLPSLAQEYASFNIPVDFTSHHFRHTLNTLLDEGGLPELLQTEWFGRSNSRDTKAYQHTSPEKRALLVREQLKSGAAGGHLAEQLKIIPIRLHDAFLQAKIAAVHDVGPGICVHNFVQLPCERHLQCSADCADYIWIKDEDDARINEVKRQYAVTLHAQQLAKQLSTTSKPKRSSDWLVHNEKKLKTLLQQLHDHGISDFDPHKYLTEVEHSEVQKNL